MRKSLEIVTVTAFLLIIILPLILFQDSGRASMMENKTTAERPALTAENLLDSTTPQDFDTYFSDNIGLKDQATLQYISWIYRIFHKVAIPNYIEGKDHNMFYMPAAIMASYQGLDQITEEQKRAVADKLETLAETAQIYGSQLIYMPIPNKDTVYRELMPSSIHVISEASMLSCVTEYLQTRTSVVVADTEQDLLAHKDDGMMLYYRNLDVAHWNGYGMFIGYQTLINSIRSTGADVPLLSEQDAVITETPVHRPFQSLSQYPIIGETFSGFDDVIYDVSPADGWHGQLDNSVPAEYSLANDSYSRYFHYHNDALAEGKTLVIYGDSYIYDYMLPMLSESFREVYFLNGNVCGETELMELLSLITPDFITYETVSRQANYDRLMSVGEIMCNAVEKANTVMTVNDLLEYPVSVGPFAIHFDDPEIEENHTISLSSHIQSENLMITGWAADFDAESSSGGVVFQVGDCIIPTEIYERPDLGGNYMSSGYRATIPAELVTGITEIQVTAFTSDKAARVPLIAISLK